MTMGQLHRRSPLSSIVSSTRFFGKHSSVTRIFSAIPVSGQKRTPIEARRTKSHFPMESFPLDGSAKLLNDAVVPNRPANHGKGTHPLRAILGRAHRQVNNRQGLYQRTSFGTGRNVTGCPVRLYQKVPFGTPTSCSFREVHAGEEGRKKRVSQSLLRRYSPPKISLNT